MLEDSHMTILFNFIDIMKMFNISAVNSALNIFNLNINLSKFSFSLTKIYPDEKEIDNEKTNFAFNATLTSKDMNPSHFSPAFVNFCFTRTFESRNYEFINPSKIYTTKNTNSFILETYNYPGHDKVATCLAGVVFNEELIDNKTFKYVKLKIQKIESEPKEGFTDQYYIDNNGNIIIQSEQISKEDTTENKQTKTNDGYRTPENDSLNSFNNFNCLNEIQFIQLVSKDIKVKSTSGQNLLHYFSCFPNGASVVQILIDDFKFDIDLKDNFGKTALFF